MKISLTDIWLYIIGKDKWGNLLLSPLKYHDKWKSDTAKEIKIKIKSKKKTLIKKRD